MVKPKKQPINLNAEEPTTEKAAINFPIPELITTILSDALKQSAVAIHLEPNRDDIGIRYRIAGQLQPAMTLPRNIFPALIQEIKTQADLKTDETNLPQEGRLSFKAANQLTEFFVSIFPTIDGEKIVLCPILALDPKTNLKDLGFDAPTRSIIQKSLRQNGGLIIIVGPRHSGRTATFHALVKELDTPEINVALLDEANHLWLEVSCLEIKSPDTPEGVLAAAAQQDLDVIAVSTIKNRATTQLASRLAAAGKTIITKITGDDPWDAIEFFLQLKVSPAIIATALKLVITQRQVKKICPFCRASYRPDKKMIKNISHWLGLKTITLRPEDKKIKNLLAKDFYRGNGCSKCRQTGYLDQIGIFEVLEITPELKKSIAEGQPTLTLKKLIQKNTPTIKENALIKANAGLTTLEEILNL